MNLTFFENLLTTFEGENRLRDKIREVVRDWDKETRVTTAILSQVHSNTTPEGIQSLITKLTPKITDLSAHIARLKEIVPGNLIYKYNHMWNISLQQTIYICTFFVYLKQERLVTPQDIQDLLGGMIHSRVTLIEPVPVSITQDLQEFHISLEDFLLGIISITSELSRLCVNCVTAGDFSRPKKIWVFVENLYAGFQLLNLKNDILRRKFDSVKYDLKKIEEVVYDVQVRGLNKE